MRRGIRDRLREERGSTLPLVLVYAAIGLVLVVIAGAATSLYVERKRLYTLADAAALVAAESADLAGPGPRRLEDAEVRSAARSYLDDAGPARFEGLALEDAATRDGRSATVTLSALWRPPLLGPLLPEGVRLEVTSSARSTMW